VLGVEASLEQVAWEEFGEVAGIPDLHTFRACAGGAFTFARIDSGLAASRRIGIRSTPTVMVNGWHLRAPPTSALLSRIINDLLAGKEPLS
jgi:hypothetical protein